MHEIRPTNRGDAASPGTARSDEAAHTMRPEDRIGARAWLALVILILLTICSYVDRTILSLMVDPIKRDLNLTDVQISLLQGLAFALIFALSSLPLAWISDRVSRRLVLMIGVSIWSFATMACGLAQNYWHLFWARFGVGVGEAALPPSAYGIVAEIFPKRRLALGIGILAAGAALGSSLAYMLGGVAIAWGGAHAAQFGMADWQFVFLMVGLPGLILLPLILLIPKPIRSAHAATTSLEDSRDYANWMRRNGAYVVLMGLGVGCYGAVAVAVAAWAPSFLIRHFDQDIGTIGLLLGGLHLVTGVFGFIGSGWLVDRLHAGGVKNAHFRYLIFSGIGTAGISLAWMAFMDSLPAILCLLGIFYAITPVAGPALGYLQLNSPARFHGRTVALYQLLMQLLAMVLGPMSAALLTEKVFGGPEFIGWGLATTALIFAPMGAALITLSWAFSPSVDRLETGGGVTKSELALSE